MSVSKITLHEVLNIEHSFLKAGSNHAEGQSLETVSELSSGISFQERCRIVADMLGTHTIDERMIPCPFLSLPQLKVKRGMDLVFASVALLIFSVPMLVIALLIKLESKGPIFYRQERVGLGGRRFHMLKFRSMKLNAEASSGAVWAIKNDPRRTKFGTLLRTTSLDELPQLFNVFRGEMSMVGPRPERPNFVAEFRKDVLNYDLRHHVPVGITGWAQVHGWRGNTSIQKRVGYDIFYILHWSPWLDIRTLFLTLFRGFINRNAY